MAKFKEIVTQKIKLAKVVVKEKKILVQTLLNSMKNLE